MLQSSKLESLARVFACASSLLIRPWAAPITTDANGGASTGPAVALLVALANGKGSTGLVVTKAIAVVITKAVAVALASTRPGSAFAAVSKGRKK